jgi:hypothetical protein
VKESLVSVTECAGVNGVRKCKTIKPGPQLPEGSAFDIEMATENTKI